MMDFVNNIYFWIIAFFVVVVILILMMVFFMLIKMKTHAFVELKAFFKKTPVSLFFDDGKFLEMKASPIDTGIVTDKNYGCFIRNEKNTYLGKITRNVYDVYDTGFAPGINIKAAESASKIRELITDENDYDLIAEQIANGKLKDQRIDVLKTNISTASLKNFYNYIEPHNINASVEKKVAQKIRSINEKGNTQIILTFIAVFGAIIGGYILLKIFNVG